MTPWLWLLCVLCSARVTRFVVFDSLAGLHLDSGTDVSVRLEAWAFDGLGHPRSWWQGKLATLCTCVWCAGFWVTLATCCAAQQVWPWGLDGEGWVEVWAAAFPAAWLVQAQHNLTK